MKVNDVYQLSPEVGNSHFAGCFMVITEVKPWGAQGYVRVPGGGDAYYRAEHEEMEYVGRAIWVHPEDQEVIIQ